MLFGEFGYAWRLTVPGILSATNELSDKRKELPHAISVCIFFLNLKQTPKETKKLPKPEAEEAPGLSPGLRAVRGGGAAAGGQASRAERRRQRREPGALTDRKSNV